MKKFKYTSILLATIFWASVINAQQQAQYTQYMYNTLMVNPAYAGTAHKLEATFIHRSQWVGLEGAPRTQNFGVNGAIKDIIGLGLNVTNDKLGPERQTMITAAVAAKIKLSRKVKLSLGVNGGMDLISVDWSMGQAKSDNDEAFNQNIKNRVRPVIGAGLYVYSDNWYVGLSSPTFIQKDRYGKLGEAAIDNRTHFYLIAGYVFDIGEDLKLKPALLTKAVAGAPITADISLNALIKEQFTVGAGYRYNDAVSILLGYTFKNMLFLGYSYDINVTKLRKYNSGSHDIMIKYNLWEKNAVARSPRFF